jgi:hypothetical protein
MGKRLIITENEKEKIKKLYLINEKIENLNSQTQSKYNQINNLDLSDCDRVRDELSQENVKNRQYEIEKMFISSVDNVKYAKGGLNLATTLLLFMTNLCLCIQIIKTSKSKNWGIKKDYFTDMYNSCSNIEFYFNTSYATKVVQFLKTFRSKYNEM